MGCTQRMLIAHPDERYRSALRRWFGRRGHEVVTVDSGVTCVRALRDKTPDVLVLHQGLLWGGADGVLEVMRQDGFSDVSVVMLQGATPQSRPKRRATREIAPNVSPVATPTSGYDVFA